MRRYVTYAPARAKKIRHVLLLKTYVENLVLDLLGSSFILVDRDNVNKSRKWINRYVRRQNLINGDTY